MELFIFFQSQLDIFEICETNQSNLGISVGTLRSEENDEELKIHELRYTLFNSYKLVTRTSYEF